MNSSPGSTFITHPLAPVWDAESTVLMLGTMPSPKSREAGFYYMHPQNRFWPVMSAVTGTVLRYDNRGMPAGQSDTRESGANNTATDREAAIAERCALMLSARIALWDVLAGCDICGAGDATIRNPVPNDFSALLAGARISRVYCTGQTAFSLYTRLCEPATKIAAVCLPSTSPANRGRWPLENLITAYQIVVK